MKSRTVTSCLRLHVDAREVAVAEPGEEERGLAQGLRGERAGVRGGPASDGLLLDQGHRLAEVRRLRGPLLPRRPGADDDQVEIPSFHDGPWPPFHPG